MRIYTDGACRFKIGGWGWYNEETDVGMSGCVIPSTNQRMELTAALDAVRTHMRVPEFTIVSDSAYVVNCFLNGWWESWIAHNWYGRNTGPIKNVDIWQPLIELVLEHGNITFEWVKGHSGVPGNEMADQLASKEVAEALSRSRK